jgi:hypothetical protein
MITSHMQNKVIVMCDFMDFIKLAQNDIYMFYCNPYVKFEIHIVIILIILKP